ncbi:cyclohexanone monooxygenase [Talaromyces proteolyticus]|uniref:Cyclohexanone monooxygenase n=1 Tax=Talaromyces proteolyticus TaxID=1131652 RepID=A0AAD4KDN9_9EURO|nr:cyclohexanone monooxygenase [Talaromyces proteolyticus]KAH8689344.1 cyclohexanone monooxygenase [Talaromyces proteolyticus]
MAIEKIYDALVVGTGFAGIYQLYRLVKLGLSVKVIDKAGGPGGTWYWNRYPGALSDTWSFAYRYSWDLEDLKTYKWSNHYVHGPEVLAYLEHVIDRHDLRKYIQFNTEFLGAKYDEDLSIWTVETTQGHLKARYLITALGLLNNENWPSIPKKDEFKGYAFHTANIPQNYSFKGKKVGVIGCGSTGIQVITALAPEVEHLTCFQRRPQYSVPAVNIPATKEYRDNINDNYEKIWDQVRGSFIAMGFKESTISALSVSDEDRDRIYQRAWERGNGLHFMFGTFCDITTNEAANKTAADFIRNKIDQIVKDPKKAEKLKPTDMFARRPLCDSGYYESFNQDNVDLVDLKSAPFDKFTPDGIKTIDGVEHKLDVVICATGFNAVDGSYANLNIRGRRGKTLKEHWEADPSTYLGCAVSGFPNLFLLLGPKSVFANIPPAIESQVEFLSGVIARAEELRKTDASGRKVVLETTEASEAKWRELCEKAAVSSLFTKTDSWIFGANVVGKKKSILFYWGGLGTFRNIIKEEIESNYKGFYPFLQ